MEERLRALFVTAEVTPFARTGGLGDMTAALSQVLVALGHDVRLVMPLYQTVRDSEFPLTEVMTDLSVPLVTGRRTARVWQGAFPGQEGPTGVPVYFIEQDDYFARPGLYGDGTGDYTDNAQRFIFFCRAALALTEDLAWFPHVFHCHDWHTALVPPFLRFLSELDARLSAAATLFTIHNLAYQGWFPTWVFGITGLPLSLFQIAGVEFFGLMNFMKAGLHYADQLSTVSPTYAEEICTPELGFGLDGVLRERHDVLTGILNGVDYQEWNPATDPVLAAHYSAADLTGKTRCKRALLRTYAMPEDLETPVVGLISRLVEQKGVDIVVDAIAPLLTLGLRLVVLGSGEARHERRFTDLGRRYPAQVGVRLGFDNTLAHQIQAGSDCLLMPSRYEPCGLTQLYSLRYGTIPIVRATGGLRDTVVPFDPASGQGTGFVFQEPRADALVEATRAAQRVFADRQAWERLQRNAMAQDFSWGQSAARYLDLYRRAMATR
ncbi:MAG TPA: glycogen synthase GlgA [Candidatus Binatia bacterium]|nr:glycogen synthase GlgA [Candidatus Binatia bacterium]